MKSIKNQKRKYTLEPYITHPVKVSRILEDTFSSTPELYIYFDKHSIRYNCIIAALLHDTVEDTDTTFNEIEENFGIRIRNILYYLTDISKPEDGNRKIRKEIDIYHNLNGPIESILVKLADIIDNCSSIKENDPEFAKRYLKEKQNFLLKIKDTGMYNKFKEGLEKPLFEVFDYLYNKAQEIIK